MFVTSSRSRARHRASMKDGTNNPAVVSQRCHINSPALMQQSASRCPAGQPHISQPCEKGRRHMCSSRFKGGRKSPLQPHGNSRSRPHSSTAPPIPKREGINRPPTGTSATTTSRARSTATHRGAPLAGGQRPFVSWSDRGQNLRKLRIPTRTTLRALR